MRIIHIVSAITLVGGALAWCYGVLPATAALAADTGTKVRDAMMSAWRPFVLAAVAGILVSGAFNFWRKMETTALTPAYHAVFGVKALLALHVLAVSYIATKPGGTKRSRQLKGVAISGIAVVILSAVLRWLTQ